MHIHNLSEVDLGLLMKLREEAERIVQNVAETERPQTLSQLYAWRNDKIFTKLKTNS